MPLWRFEVSSVGYDEGLPRFPFYFIERDTIQGNRKNQQRELSVRPAIRNATCGYSKVMKYMGKSVYYQMYGTLCGADV
jgi:hypothetical protein